MKISNRATKLLFTILAPALLSMSAFGQEHPQHDDHHGEATEQHVDDHANHDDHADHHGEADQEFDAVDMIMHHIQDAHEWHLVDIPQEDGTSKPVSIPLPVILYYNGQLDVFMSSAFHHGHSPVTKGDVTYIMDHGNIYVANAQGELEYDEEHHALNDKPLDLSITKNVAAMFLSILLLVWIFGSTAKNYKKTHVPRGMAKFMEPLVLFVRDDIARPNIEGDKYKRYLPFLLTIFFFIWINNLLGLIPVLAPNVTGNIAFTFVLAAFTLLIILFSGNKAYWGHILLPPVPWWLYIIMVPVEIIGIFTKPFALMIRLFANITAGHILILSLVSLIFIFKTAWMSLMSVPFMIFMFTLELLVAALQAYIFTLLAALFIGMAVEEHHGHGEEDVI